MAKEKPRCVICGQETEFFRRASLPLYNTNQIVCSDCRQRYDSASGQERAKLKERMLNSPYLWDRERIDSLMKWKQEEARRLASENMNVLRAAHREQAIMCCGGKMTLQGHSVLQMAEGSIKTEQIPMSVYQCEVCGQLKFFRFQPVTEE